MRKIAQHLQQLAARQFWSVLPGSPYAHGWFKALATVEIDGEVKPLLLVGSAHRHFEDGYCIAVLNPEQALVDEIPPGCAYTNSVLREQVRKRCDAAVLVLFGGGSGQDGSVIGAYTTKTPTPSRFCVT
jgi:hypothetical protein